MDTRPLVTPIDPPRVPQNAGTPIQQPTIQDSVHDNPIPEDLPDTSILDMGMSHRAPQSGPEIFPSREAALRQARRDAGIPDNQRPVRIESVPLRDAYDQPIIENGERVMSREYHYESTPRTGANPATGEIPEEIIIQEHSHGHDFGGTGDQGSHFNVRPSENTRTGSITGTREHYSY